MSLKDLTSESVHALADAADVPLRPGDAELVSAALTRYARSFQAMERIDVEGVDPALLWNPRWE